MVKNIFSLDPLFLNRLLRQESLEKAMRALRMLIIALCFFLVIYIIREVVVSLLAVSTEISAIQNAVSTAPISTNSKQKKISPDYQTLKTHLIFGSFENKAKAAQTTAKPISNLALNLIGTFITTGESPYAIIEDDKKKVQDVFNLKDKIFDEATLVAIYSDRVDIERNGKIEVLKMDQAPDKAGSAKSTGISEVGSDEFVVEETELNAAIENLPLVLTQARAVPYFKDGKSIGLRMFAIRSGSIFEKIGLKNGDILKSVNGQSLADLTQAVKLFEKLKEERSVNVVLERDRQDRDFKYQIR